MIQSIANLFKQVLDGNDLSGSELNNPNLAIAALLCEVSKADYEVDVSENIAKRKLVQHLTGISEIEATALLAEAEDKVKQSASLYDFTSHLRELEQDKRYELVKAMWEVANADGVIDPMEDAVIRKVAELLYVDHSEFIRAKLSVVDK
ncbi:TerB family tellurite resistance protein [Vibrio sp. HN007]|uniref:tellurite resistance TerB family protein n=1 Tax=Vibrio iocasae TaxID=3098914 RepID=UPI0035D41556